ncbi:MAG: DUF1559 domain-containing protein, partial [Planctomycetales bacterium]|nr:DUF1559 domain-containing protein [Planctomycetales bacterium]
QLMKVLQAQARRSDEQRVLADAIPWLLKTALTSPCAAYVADLQINEGAIDVDAALVIAVDADKREKFQRQLDRVVKMAPFYRQLKTVTIAGVEWTEPPLDRGAPPVRWGWTDGGEFALAIGSSAPEQLTSRLGGSAPTWLDELRNDLPVEREASIGYLNVAAIRELALPLVARRTPRAAEIVEKLGLDSVRAIEGRGGLDQVGCVSVGRLIVDGAPRGIVQLIPHEPLKRRDLERIPADALAAMAVRCDYEALFDDVVAVVSDVQPRGAEHLEQVLERVSTRLDVDVRRDVLASLGDVTTGFVPGGDLFTSWTGIVATTSVKDAARLREAIGKIAAEINRRSGADRRGGSIRESTYAGETIYTIDFGRAPAPVAPSWCVTEDRLIVGLMPQAVRTSIDPMQGPSLADLDSVRDALALGNGASALDYHDTKRLVQAIYPWLQFGLQMASSELRREGVDIDVSILPAVDVLTRHMYPTVSVLAPTSDGFRWEVRGPLPSSGNAAAALPAVAALGVPAISQARQGAQRAQQLNNFKQIALACLNYESAYRKLPSDIYSEDGTPLLSWRVRILPFLEEQALYTQFHLDEPWDSPHNKPLLDQMPWPYVSEGGDRVGGRTLIVALRGANTLFPLDKNDGIPLRQITDGTSNTLLCVQASPRNAVEWTAPRDLTLEGAEPARDLGQFGLFAAAMCDGSCRIRPTSLSKELLEAMATRNGGEVYSEEDSEVVRPRR